jgi:EAL domain-containing protein (putative c-di-GMP-specific phosphodiesterase class I)
MLFYQPQVRLADRGLAACEALIRWRHPTRGVLAAATFLPALEAGVLAEPVGRWVIETACAQAAAWREIDPGFRVSVNLFAAQFRDGRLPRAILEALGSHGLTPDAIDLEITENIVLDRQQAVVRQLYELREAGFRLAFDAFGTGYASLNLLRSFPITHIKIDRSFTHAMHSSATDRAIVVSLTDLARQLGLKVIAEGVQSQDDCEFLASHGCDTGQGFYLGKPAPPDLFAEQFFSRPMALRA